MTVKELKELLNQIDENKNVYIVNYQGTGYTADIEILENNNVYFEDKNVRW